MTNRILDATERNLFAKLDWCVTGNEGCIAIANPTGDLFVGAISQWLDEGDGNGREYLAFFGGVYADTFDEAEDKLNECTDSNVLANVGWFRTHDGGALALADVAGFKYREHLYK